MIISKLDNAILEGLKEIIREDVEVGTDCCGEELIGQATVSLVIQEGDFLDEVNTFLG
jgi:hypothetical protein